MMKSTNFFRSSAVIFQGGGCRAAAFVGAYEEAVRRGVSAVEVAGTSAGSIVAALIGAGAKPDDLHSAIRELDFTKFLLPAENRSKRGFLGSLFEKHYPEYTRLLFDQGFYSSSEIARWVESHLERLLPRAPRPISFSSLPIPTFIVSADLVRSEAKVWSQSTTPNELVAKAVQSSCSIPLYFQPVEQRYVDGAVLSNLPAYVFANHEDSDRPLSARVLAFTLEADDRASVEWNTLSFLNMLMSTVVDGSQKLQISQQRSVHVVRIPTGSISATDFKIMTPDIADQLIRNGTESAKVFFDEELQHVRSGRSLESLCYGTDEIYAHVTDGLDLGLNRLVVAEHNTDWVYSLFPTLLCLRLRGVVIEVILPQHGDKEGDGVYRRKLLNALGASVTELPDRSALPFSAYILDTKDTTQVKEVVGIPTSYQTSEFKAVVYSGPVDATVIRALLDEFDRLHKKTRETSAAPAIVREPVGGLLALLGRVGQYSREGVALSLEDVPISQMISLTRYVREYKFKQIHHLVSAYQSNNLPLFEVGAVRFADGRQSILTPPVVEESNGKFILIEGSTRATYCRDSGKPDIIKCVVARGVHDPLPGVVVPFKDVRVVGRTLPATERYPGFAYQHFRRIENSVHKFDSLG